MPYRDDNVVFRILIIVLFFCLTSVAESGEYVVLNKTTPLASQIKTKESTYEIRDVFDLEGKTLAIPENCTLLFRGGKISNGQIVFNNTFLDGFVKIALSKNQTVRGQLANDAIYTKWFQIEKNGLPSLLQGLLKDNANKAFHIENGTYDIEEPIIIRKIEGVSFDFHGSTLIDNVKGDNQSLHRANPMIWIRESHNVTITNFNYEVSDNRYFSKAGTAVIWLGAISQDWETDIYGITISNICGKGNLVRKVKGGTSENMFISGVGNMHNIAVQNIQYDGNLATLCNFEYGLPPAESNFYKKYNISLPDYYGLHPYNLTIKDIVGKNAPSCTGFIRLSSCYNAVVENCYGYNVNSFIFLYNGDMSISRVNGSAIIRNCASYVNADYEGNNVSGLLVFNTYKDPASGQVHSAAIEHNNSYIIENCEFQGRLNLPGNGIRVSGGDGNVVITNVTVKNFGLAAKLTGVTGNRKMGGITLNNCLFENNQSSIELYLLDNCVLQGCIFRSSIIHNANKIENSQIAVYKGVEGLSVRDCVFENSSSNNKASFITFEEKESAKAEISNSRFIGISEKAVVVPKNVQLENCEIK